MLKNLSVKLILILSLVLISGCASLNIGNKVGDVQRNGDGLEVSFKISSDYPPLYSFSIELNNLGESKVILNQGDINIRTEEKISGMEVIAPISIQKFKEILFKNGVITLQPFEKRIFKGDLIFEKNFYENNLNTKATVFLDLNYKYSTKFDAEVEIDPNGKKTFSYGSINQAAPVKISKIDYLRSFSGDKILIYLSIKNKLRIKNFDALIYLGTTSLSCIPSKKTEFGLERLENNILYSDSGINFLLVCDSDLSRFDISTITRTKIYGEFNYDVLEEISSIVNFPKYRTNQLNSL